MVLFNNITSAQAIALRHLALVPRHGMICGHSAGLDHHLRAICAKPGGINNRVRRVIRPRRNPRQQSLQFRSLFGPDSSVCCFRNLSRFTATRPAQSFEAKAKRTA